MKKNKKPLLVLDGNNIAHRAYHANSGLSHKGKSTAVIFGVINMLRALVTAHSPHRILVVWDGSKSPHRLKLCPDYKNSTARRKGRDGFDYEDWNRQKTYTQRLIRRLGIGQVWKKDMEADDYIYWIVSKHYGKRPIKIVSNDKDFHQLVSEGVSQLLHKPTLGDVELKIETFDTDLQEFYPKIPFFDGITPAQHLDFLILTGDTSDNIKGYPGIGDKRGNDFLQEFDYIETYLEDITLTSKLDHKKLEEIYALNKPLIDLEYFHMKYLKGKVELEYLFGESKGKPDMTKFVKLAMKFNMKTFTKYSFLKSFGF